MKAEFLRSKKTGTINKRIKGILCLIVICAIITPIIPAQADTTTRSNGQEADWKQYPYYPTGTLISFPLDEGAHDTAIFPIEWWYVNFHLIGNDTGNEYGSFVAFYKIQTSMMDKKEVRIFSISDIEAEKNYTNTKIGTLTASSDYLNLNFAYITNDYKKTEQSSTGAISSNLIYENLEMMNTLDRETIDISTNQITLMNLPYSNLSSMANTIDICEKNYQEEGDELKQHDYWYTKTNDQGLLPFQYTLIVGGNSKQDSQPMELNVDMDCQKKPLIVGRDGVIYYGYDAFSYYYGLTKLTVNGTISVHGVTEEVTGNAWIDHQWGNFINQNPPPWGLTITYEWFSIQLVDNREIVVGDMWNRETGEKMSLSYTDGLNLINSDGSIKLLYDYQITPLSFWNDTSDKHVYSNKWHLTEASRSIDLIVTPVFQNQMMRFKENHQLLQQILEELFPGACFWEGVGIVTGTINDIPVNGKAYVELTHYYDTAEK